MYTVSRGKHSTLSVVVFELFRDVTKMVLFLRDLTFQTFDRLVQSFAVVVDGFMLCGNQIIFCVFATFGGDRPNYKNNQNDCFKSIEHKIDDDDLVTVHCCFVVGELWI